METQSPQSQEASTPAATEGSLWKRAAFMVFFAIVMRIVEFVVFLLMVAQFIAKLATGRTVAGMTDLGERLSQYLAQVVRYQTFNTEQRPYPFSAFPGQGAGKGGEESKSSPDAPQESSPNPA